MPFDNSPLGGGILASLLNQQPQAAPLMGGLFGLGQQSGLSPFAMPPAAQPSPLPTPQIDMSNFHSASSDMNLTPQEQLLYKMHLRNLYGQGGVDNADGSRSSLFQSVTQGPDGKYYNIPTVWNGRIETQRYVRPSDGKVFQIPNQTALANVARMGWQNFPSYDTPEEADQRYSQMHDYMDKDTARFLNLRR